MKRALIIEGEWKGERCTVLQSQYIMQDNRGHWVSIDGLDPRLHHWVCNEHLCIPIPLMWEGEVIKQDE